MKANERSDILHIGLIAAPHGIKGEVRVQSLSEAADRFRGLSRCLLVSPDGKIRDDATITQARVAKNMWLIALEGLSTRDQAELLRGWYLSVPRDLAIELDEGEHFISDLIGCDVLDAQDQRLGTLRDILKTGANDVYIVNRDGRKDLLIPVIRDVVRSVDIDAREIRVTLPDGLLDLYD